MLTVQKGVPLPPAAKSRKFDFPEMEIGDSFFISADENKNPYISAYQHYRKKGMKISGRKENEGMRIWRVE